ncbi:MAG: 4Fe-4S binding protein [Thermoleophilia bacterium]|nr:4Fe-4S binding protein [Thermoleophilia bacterium]
MAKKGLLIHYEYCTGCMACVVACKQEHDYPAGRWGIMVKDCTRETEGRVQVDFLPFPTDLCDLCPGRTHSGGKPACVKHCMAACISYGELPELAKEMEGKPRSALFAPR